MKPLFRPEPRRLPKMCNAKQCRCKPAPKSASYRALGMFALGMAIIAIVVAVSSLGFGAEPKADRSFAFYTPFNVPLSDGTIQAAMFTPGTTAGSVVLIFQDFSLYDVTPRTGPGPIPPPPPPPPPPPGKRLVFVLWESAEPTFAQSTVVHGLRKWTIDKGHVWRLEDDDTQAAWVAPYLTHVEAAGVSSPALIVAEISNANTTTVLAVKALPKTLAEATAFVVANGG